MRYDVAVVGLGGIGSAILAHCARRGARAIGLEQFTRGHELGSSTGLSRMIRKAYFEDPAYVPLLLRAYELWQELERETGVELLRCTGLLMVGEEESEIIAGATRAARQHSLGYEALSAAVIRVRYPMLQVREEEVGLFEPDGGVLDPERSSEAHRQAAEAAGAELRFENALENWRPQGSGFLLQMADGAEIGCDALVLSLGPWFRVALASLGVALTVERNVQAWFEPAHPFYAASRFPPFLLDRRGLPAPLYGFPDFGQGVKAAFHSHGASGEIGSLDRGIDLARDIAPIQETMEAWMPGATARFLGAKPCPYSLTPDGHFVLDRHPNHARLVLCGGFSGHGFKFAPVIGEIAADLALAGASSHKTDFLSLQRFAAER